MVPRSTDRPVTLNVVFKQSFLPPPRVVCRAQAADIGQFGQLCLWPNQLWTLPEVECVGLVPGWVGVSNTPYICTQTCILTQKHGFVARSTQCIGLLTWIAIYTTIYSVVPSTWMLAAYVSGVLSTSDWVCFASSDVLADETDEKAIELAMGGVCNCCAGMLWVESGMCWRLWGR